MIQRVMVFVENNFAYAGLSVYVIGYGPKDEHFLGKPIEFVETDIQNTNNVPTFTLKNDEAQVLMDALWNAGIKPTEGMGSAGSLSATQDHVKTLKDVTQKLFELLSKKSGV